MCPQNTVGADYCGENCDRPGVVDDNDVAAAAGALYSGSAHPSADEFDGICRRHRWWKDRLLWQLGLIVTGSRNDAGLIATGGCDHCHLYLTWPAPKAVEPTLHNLVGAYQQMEEPDGTDPPAAEKDFAHNFPLAYPQTKLHLVGEAVVAAAAPGADLPQIDPTDVPADQIPLRTQRTPAMRQRTGPFEQFSLAMGAAIAMVVSVAVDVSENLVSDRL